MQENQTVPPDREKKPPPRAKKLSFKEERELGELLAGIDADEERIRALEGQLADPDTYKNGGTDIKSLQAELTELQDGLTAKMERWEDLESRKTRPS